MTHTKQRRRIVAALVAFAMIVSLTMPVLAETGQTDPPQAAGLSLKVVISGTSMEITPDNWETYKSFAAYDGATGTYTLDFGDIREDITIGDESATGDRPNLKLKGNLGSNPMSRIRLVNLDQVELEGNCVGTLYLANINDVTVNGNVTQLLTEQGTEIGKITITGDLPWAVAATATNDIEVSGRVAAGDTIAPASWIQLTSENGNVTVDIPEGNAVQTELYLYAPNGNVTLTGNAETLLPKGLIAFGQELHITNKREGGTIGAVKFSPTLSDTDYTINGTEDAVKNDNGEINIAAEDSGNTLTIEPKIIIPGRDLTVGEGVMAVVGGAVLGGAAIWGGYELATRAILHNLLPEGAAIPANRGELALLAWQTAGKPEPAAQPAFADITDPELAKAAQWCVEQGVLEATDGSFRPEDHMAKFRVIEAWRKAF